VQLCVHGALTECLLCLGWWLHNDALRFPATRHNAHITILLVRTLQSSLSLSTPRLTHQVNEFLKLLAHTGIVDKLKEGAEGSSSGSSAGRTVRVVDCGCGSSHLTFGTFHYLNNVLGLRASLLGVDFNAKLMERSNAYRCGVAALLELAYLPEPPRPNCCGHYRASIFLLPSRRGLHGQPCYCASCQHAKVPA
jgi:hypothetical protein